MNHSDYQLKWTTITDNVTKWDDYTARAEAGNYTMVVSRPSTRRGQGHGADPKDWLLARNRRKQPQRRRVPHHLGRGRRSEHDRDSREGQDGPDVPRNILIQVRHAHQLLT